MFIQYFVQNILFICVGLLHDALPDVFLYCIYFRSGCVCGQLYVDS